MNILFYYPSNKRTVSIESVIIKFKEQGHTLSLLTHTENDELHDELKKHNIATYVYCIPKKNALLYYIKHILFLIRFVNKNKINIVYSHLQQANIISVFAQFFCRAKFYICRHHSDRSGLEKNFNQTLFDKIINRLAKLIIVPSLKVYDQNVNIEKANPKKIKLIYYGYDFSEYAKPNTEEISKLKKQYHAKLILVKIARLVPSKRYEILFDVLKELILDLKMDIKLVAVSDGPLMSKYIEYIQQNNLQNNIFLVGQKSNIIDYLSLGDAIVHVSETEASNSVIKEAGLVKKCVLVCNDVGDFDDYISDNKSGLFLNKIDPKNDLKKYILDLYESKIDTAALGNELFKSVNNTFSIEKVIEKYTELNN